MTARSMSEELLEVVNEQGEVVSVAPRSVIHGNPDLIHRVVHVLVFNSKGRLALQRRALSKDVAPGKWDTSVGGHVEPGEGLLEAAMRELEEELGVEGRPEFLYSYRHSNPYETELVYTFIITHEGGPKGVFSFNRQEIDEVRFWDMDEILMHMEEGSLSDNFKDEIRAYLRHKGG